jgi:hypothetical protein
MDKNAIRSYLSADEKIIDKLNQGVDYLGGHPPFGKPYREGGIFITDKRVIFSKASENRIFSIPYEDIVDISTETKERLTATRVVLTGLIAFAWKKKEKFLLIEFKNDIGETSKVGFGFSKSDPESWPTIRWAEVITKQRYNWFRNKKAPS